MSDLVRTQLEKSLKVKSLSDLVKRTTDGTVWLMLDVSGSMNDEMRNGKSKMDGLHEVVNDIRQNATTKLITFGGRESRVVQMVPPRGAGGTPLTDAIIVARSESVQHAIVISDGIPDDKRSAMTAAREFGGKIDVIYVGDPHDPDDPYSVDDGEKFLRELAAATGGSTFSGDLSRPKEIASAIMGLLGQGDTD